MGIPTCQLFKMRLFLYFLIYQQAQAIVKNRVYFDDKITGVFDGQCDGECGESRLEEAKTYLEKIACKEISCRNETKFSCESTIDSEDSEIQIIILEDGKITLITQNFKVEFKNVDYEQDFDCLIEKYNANFETGSDWSHDPIDGASVAIENDFQLAEIFFISIFSGFAFIFMLGFIVIGLKGFNVMAVVFGAIFTLLIIGSIGAIGFFMYVGEIDAAVGGGLIGAIFGFAVIFALIMYFATKSKKKSKASSKSYEMSNRSTISNPYEQQITAPKMPSMRAARASPQFSEVIYETDYPVRGKKSEAGQWDDTVQRMSIQAGKKAYQGVDKKVKKSMKQVNEEFKSVMNTINSEKF